MHGHSDYQYNDDKRKAREEHIHEREQALFKRENILGYIDLFNQRSGVDNRGQRARRCLAHKVEYKRTRQVVNDEIVNLEFEDVRENRVYNQSHQQGIEYAPQKAQKASAVLYLEVSRYQVTQQITVFTEALIGLP